MVNQQEKYLEIYSWSNVDGHVSLFKSWSDLLTHENWEYLESYSDSLDIYHAGRLMEIDSPEDARGKMYYRKQNDMVYEHDDEVLIDDIKILYYGEALVDCIPSKARKKAEWIKY